MDYQKAIDFILDRLKQDLPPELKYHAVKHTASVIRNCRKIAGAEGVSGRDLQLLITAAAYHDSGFLKSYERNEPQGCEIAKEHLPKFGFSEHDIKVICGMIMATQPPQSPKTKLEEILCDADLFYLGGDQYDEIADTLYEELFLHGKKMSEKEWLDLQIESLENHQYFTEYAKRTRDANKQSILDYLHQQKLNRYRKSGS